MTRIGLLSDSHGHARITAQAAQTLADHGAQLLIHLGDIEQPAVLEALLVQSGDGESPLPVRVVFGNVDYNSGDLGRYAAELGIHNDHPAGKLELPEGVLVFMHGHDHRAMERELAAGVNWLCHGHTHKASDHRQGKTRIINPGALHRAKRYTVALLDTANDELTFHPISQA